MNMRKLGSSQLEVSAVGLGCMGMSGMYGLSDRAESVATIQAALDAGVTLLDTGDFYGMGDNEMLIADALKGVKREEYQLSVKFGALRGPDGSWHGYDCRPQAIKNFLTYSLQRLGVEYIDIYRPARLDAAVPIEETVGALGELVTAGYIRHVGLSEVGAATLRRAQAVHPIIDLQIEYSILSRGIEREILPAARELGVGITAYGVLSRGLLSGTWKAGQTGDFRGAIPRFQGEHLDANLHLVNALAMVAAEKGVTTSQLAVAWVLHQGIDIVPIVGARQRAQLSETLSTLDIDLNSKEVDAIDRAIPEGAVSGARYPDLQLAHMDSER